MPFKSEKQRKWMWANDPEMARKWENEEVSNIREKIKNIIREEIKSLNEEKYIVASIYGDLYTPKAVPEKKALKLMMKLAKQYAGDNVFMLGVKAWNKPHKYNKKKIKVKEGKLSEATVRINSYTDADFHSQGMALVGKKAKIGLDKKAMKSLLQIIKNKLGNSLACENTIDEAGAVLNNGIKIDVGFGGVTFFARNGQKIPLNRSELERFVKAIHKQAKINCWQENIMKLTKKIKT